jgi:signal transduction histidine kinase
MLRWLPARRHWALKGRPLGLRARIALLVSSGLVALMVLFIVLALAAVSDSTKRDLKSREALAGMAAAHLDFVLAHTAGSLERAAPKLAAEIETGDRRAIRASVLDTLGTASGRFLFFGAGGDLTQVEPSAPDFSYPRLSPFALQRLADGEAFAIDHVRSSSGTIGLVIVPVTGRAGRIGYLGATIDLHDPAIAHLLGQMALGETGQVDLVDGRGNVLMSTSGELLPEPPGHAGYFTGLMAEGATVVTTCYNCHATSGGASRRVDVMAFAPLAATDWGIMLRQAESEVLEPTMRLQRQVTALGVMALIVAMLFVWVSTRSIVGPIRALTLSARGIAEGSLDKPVAIRASGEIAELASTLDYMRTQLQRSIDEITRYNAELDRRVHDRTLELERSRDELAASLDRLHTLVERISALNAMAVSLNQPVGPEGFLTGALLNALRLSGMELGAIYLLNERTGELDLATQHALDPEIAGSASNFGLSASLCAAAARAGKQLVMVDVAGSTEEDLRVLRRENIVCLARVPFKAAEEFLGTMCLASRMPTRLAREEIDLLVSISSQMAVAVQNSRLYRELQRKEKMRGELLENVIAAQEEERKRIARELHDQTSQALAALSMLVETAIAQAAAGGDVAGSLAPMRSLTLSTLEEVHRLIFDLRPTLLDDLGLIAAIRWYAEERLGPLGMQVRVEVIGEERRLGPQVETALYRVVQEATNNAANHSGARNFAVTLVWRARLLSLSMVDDGQGFDMADLARSTDRKRGLGIIGMQERVELLGGSLAVYSEPGSGTEIVLEVPLDSFENGAKGHV